MTAAALIRNEAKRQGISLNLAILQQSRALEVPVETLREWMWPRKRKLVRERDFWTTILGRLSTVAKTVRRHGAEHPVDEATLAELKTRIRDLGESVLRQEVGGKESK